MGTEQLILAAECCNYYNIEISFINSLQEFGLIEIITVEEKEFIHSDQLSELEKFTHMHYELDINLEGIEAISHLLHKVKDLQQEIRLLKSKLELFELQGKVE